MQQSALHNVEQLLEQTGEAVWGWPEFPMPLMVVLLLGTGLYLTLRLRFINIRGFWHAIRVVRGVYDDPDDPGDISHFQALSTALSATVGVGNIAGVATALHYGGPGALFWMWVTGLVGMSTKFSECTLALRYRIDHADGTVSGGPMYYIEKGLGARWKPLAVLFAACATITSFATGNAIQAHTMADAMLSAYRIPTWVTGIVSVTLVGLVIVGGIKRIGAFTARVVPLMAVVYFLGAVTILVLHVGAIPRAFVEIVVNAFKPTAAVGGFAGAGFMFTLIWGVKRGLFSNEAGQGSAPIAHAAARTDEPVREGSVALLEPFIDTLSICTLTGLVLLVTGVWHGKHEAIYPLDGQSRIALVGPKCEIGVNKQPAASCTLQPGTYPIVRGQLEGLRLERFGSLVDEAHLLFEGDLLDGAQVVVVADRSWRVERRGQLLNGVEVQGRFLENGEPMTAWAFQRGLAPILPFGEHIVTLCVFLFALSTAIGWSYYGDRSAEYLMGEKAIMPYRFVFLGFHFLGAVLSHEGAWSFGDVALGMMTPPNLVALVFLSNDIARMSAEYFGREHTPFIRP